MKITVVYALPDRQEVRELVLDAGADLGVALEASGLLREFPEIEGQGLAVGIYGQVASREVILNPGDRVEIYRPLNLEPKEARRKRVKKG
jgi:putative ubiquitin-RnfH superfamily antitoxin RatB of RatAB toxin-antitoxin module